MSVFEGSCVALITPFTEDGINFDALEKLIEFQIENGTDAILICGTTGEPPTMSAAEQKEAIRFSKEIINGRVPIIAGTGANSTAATIENCKMAEELGVDALLVVTPYYNKATQKGLIAHYQAVNDDLLDGRFEFRQSGSFRELSIGATAKIIVSAVIIARVKTLF